jgi:DNA-binding TFAR19-related protein (PDSD5 family)
MTKPLLILPWALLLAACAAEPSRPTTTAPAPPPRNVLAEIRTEAERYRGAFQVELIREPAIAEAIEASKQAEMRGDRAAAESALIDALDDPEARQRYAELLLARGEAARAEQLARQAYEASAQLGEWCARSWLTVAEARLLQSAPNGARQARERATACMPPRVDRY